MYVILVYDVAVERVAKALRVGRKYPTWVQNSVLEGELTQAQLERLRGELQDVLDEEEDSVLLYVLRSERWLERQELGKRKGGPEWVI